MSFNLTRYLKNCYAFSFFFYYVNSLRTSLKSSKIPHFVFHLAPILLGCAFFFYKVYIGQIGMSILGVCTTRTSEGYTFTIVLLALYILLPAYVFYYTGKYTPKNQKFFEATKQFLDYYRGYVIIVALLMLVVALCDLYIIIYAPEQIFLKHDDSGWVYLASQVMTYFRVSNPFVLVFIRLNDPLLKKPVKRFWCCCFREKYKENNEQEMNEVDVVRDRIVSLDVKLV